MKIQIRDIDETTHRAAKILAAHMGISLDKFFCDAIHAHTLRMAHARGLTDTVLREIDPDHAEPQAAKIRKPAPNRAGGAGPGKNKEGRK